MTESPQAIYDGAHAPTPWVLRSQYSVERGIVVHWIEDALGGVTVPDVSHLDGLRIVVTINAHGDLVGALTLAREYVASSDSAPDAIPTIDAALAKSIVPDKIEEPAAKPARTIDIQALAAKVRALAAAEGWDGSVSKRVAKGEDVKPGPMSRERWAESTEVARRAMEAEQILHGTAAMGDAALPAGSPVFTKDGWIETHAAHSTETTTRDLREHLQLVRKLFAALSHREGWRKHAAINEINGILSRIDTLLEEGL